jgi:hypothetical protein
MKTKVICVTDGVFELTLHKIYDGFIFQPRNSSLTPTNQLLPIQVVNDKNKLTTYRFEIFMTLSEYRELKLNELGI